MPITQTAPVGTRTALSKALAKERLRSSQIEQFLKSNALGADEVAAFQHRQFMRKGDMLTETLRSQGGCLLSTQEARFIRQLVEQATMLNAVRVEIMPADKHKISKLGVGDQVFVRGVENTEVPIGDRVEPVATEIELDATELIADLRIPYATLEDNIEGDLFVDTVLDRVGAQGAFDLERMLIHGDTTLGVGTKLNRLLSAQDGLIKRINSYTVDGDGAAMSTNILAAALKQMPEKYRQDQTLMRFFLSPNDEIDIRLQYGTRNTALGDAHMNGREQVTPLGIPVSTAPALVKGTGFLVDPRNVIFGIRRRITLEVDRDIKTRQFIFVLTCRVAVQVEETQAAVRLFDVTG